MGLSIGRTRLTADGVVGVSGKAIRIFQIILNNGSGGAGSIVVHVGTDDSGDEIDSITGSGASATDRISYTGGLYSASGIFFNLGGSNEDYVTVIYTQEQS